MKTMTKMPLIESGSNLREYFYSLKSNHFDWWRQNQSERVFDFLEANKDEDKGDFLFKGTVVVRASKKSQADQLFEKFCRRHIKLIGEDVKKEYAKPKAVDLSHIEADEDQLEFD